MKVTFWGVRGSIGTSPVSTDIENKFEKLLLEAVSAGVSSEQDVANFLEKKKAEAPFAFGGHTTCISVETSAGPIIIDAGSGIRKLAVSMLKNPSMIKDFRIAILLTHHHWDHIQGFPFFIPAFNPKMSIDIYHPEYNESDESTFEMLSFQQSSPYFPVDFNFLPSNINFYNINHFDFGDVKITPFELFHPQGSYSYKIEDKGKKFVFMTDTEVTNLMPDQQDLYREFMDGADVCVVDAQYDFKETYDKLYWGHSSIFAFIDILKHCNIKKLYMFHYDPESSDDQIMDILFRAREYLAKVPKTTSFEIHPSYEGLTIDLTDL